MPDEIGKRVATRYSTWWLWLSIGNTFSFGGKPGEIGIDLNKAEFLRVSQLMKTYEIADPVPVGLFSTDAVVMLRITVLTCSRRRCLAVLSMTDS